MKNLTPMAASLLLAESATATENTPLTLDVYNADKLAKRCWEMLPYMVIYTFGWLTLSLMTLRKFGLNS